VNAAPESSPSELPTRYDPAAVEVQLYRRWMAAGYFHADPARVLSGERAAFSMVLPPPNVNGDLHLGHALDHTLADVLARWHRMRGDEVLWLPGMDHAGIATQTMVEKQLALDGTTRFDLGRERFVEKVWDWKAEFGGAILGQMKRLGDSVDWDRERFTLDEGMSDAVTTVFKRMYDDDLIYRAERIINWCPGCRTALSDIEVDHSEDPGELVSITYGDGADAIVVATTRVETMLGDTAVAVHPDDSRYTHLIGRTVTLPLVGREIPVVADDHVDASFGTGAVKVTPAHDPNDFEIGRRHHLASLTILTEDGRITGTGTVFDGLDRFAARTAVKEALRAQGRVVAEKIPYLHAVGHCSRSDDVVEPRLSLQWFVRVASLAAAAAAAVRDGDTVIHPPELTARYFGWVGDMHDWCISRQLWWGHRIPVFYGPDGQVRCLGPDDEPPGPEWVQDPDVLDTWFSSGLWPFSTMGWPRSTDTLEAFYPTSVLVTGYDILFFWVVRMMMFGRYVGRPADQHRPSGTAMTPVPFATVMLHGLVRDRFGKKMSKSRGNGIDPMRWIDEYGADALRLSLARGAHPGSDQAIAAEWVAGSRNFCSKLFNATRFALLNGARVGAAAGTPERTGAGPVDGRTAADRWIQGRLAETVRATDELLTDFQFGKAAEGLYHFVWDELCDWYLEMAKVQIAAAEPDQQDDPAERTREILGEVLDTTLRLLHPFVPFVTETLWTTLTGRESVVVAPWPVADGPGVAELDARWMTDLDTLVTAVRRFRADQDLPPTRPVPAVITGADPGQLAEMAAALTRLTPAGPDFAASATVTVVLPGGPVTIEIDTSSVIDVAAEKGRLSRELAVAEKEIADTARKLTDQQFLSRAPERIVAGIRERAERARTEVDRISTQLSEGSGA